MRKSGHISNTLRQLVALGSGVEGKRVQKFKYFDFHTISPTFAVPPLRGGFLIEGRDQHP
jgi:hypothetical protein